MSDFAAMNARRLRSEMWARHGPTAATWTAMGQHMFGSPMEDDMSDEREIVFSANPETRRMELWEPGPSPVMTIYHDGRVVFGAHLTPNEAGKAVLRILDDLADRHAARIAELEEQNQKWVGWAKELGAKCDTLEAALAARDAEVARLREAVKIFLRCAYPVTTEIDRRGHSWSEAYLDEALPIASAALNPGGPDDQ